MTRRSVIALLPLLVVGLTAACSGDDEADSVSTTAREDVTTTTLSGETGDTESAITLAEWQRRTTLVCEEYEPQQDAVVAAHPSLATPDDVVALFDALTPLEERYIAALAEIGVPAERAADVERTYQLNEMNGQAAARARNAAASGDQSAFRVAISSIESQSGELEALLVDLGVPACISD